MFSRVFVAASKSSATGAAGMASRFRPLAGQARFVSKQAFDGSKGRAMPVQRSRATAPVDNLDATFTIRVCLSSSTAELERFQVRSCVLTFS